MDISGTARSLWVGPFVAGAMILGGCSSVPVSVSVSPASRAVDESLSVGISATVTNDTSGRGVAWSLSGPGSLSNSSGQAVTYVSPSTPITSAEQVTVTATSAADPTKSASVQITVNPYPLMGPQSLAAGTVGVSYSQSLKLLGGTSPFQWSLYTGQINGSQVGGSLPSGLTLDPATGTISGTPTAAGTWYFEPMVEDAADASQEYPVSLQINPAPSTTAANPVPFLNATLGPTAVAPGVNGLTLKVSGTGFVSGVMVDFNGTALATTFVDGEHLSAAVPADDVATAKTAAVTVANPKPGGGSSNVVFFQVGAPETTVSFVSAPNSPLQIPEPSGLAVADFNADGKPDLAVAGAVKVYSLLGAGDGTFTAAPGSPFSVPNPPWNELASPYVGPLAVGDFNRSGHPGLAVGLFSNGAAVIFGGNGDGSFTSALGLVDARGIYTSALGAADFNADGSLDLAIVNSLNGLSPVVLGYGSGAFNSAGQLDQQGLGAAIGDFNGDGKLDVADGLPVSLGNGDGTFTAAGSSPGSPTQMLSAIVAGDFNGDGKLDLAATDGQGLYVMLGNGDGTFQAPIVIAVGTEPGAIATGDFNNDGKLDLAIANEGDNTVTLLLGNGDGTFTQASGSPIAVGKGPSSIVAADFNGDGKLDLAVGNGADGTGTVSILLQQ